MAWAKEPDQSPRDLLLFTELATRDEMLDKQVLVNGGRSSGAPLGKLAARIRLLVGTSMSEQSQRSFPPAHEARALTEIIEMRQKRRIAFSENLFADPAWDAMLELYLAELEGRNLAITELADRTQVPLTTLLRWLDKLEGDRWVRRVADPTDARRVFVELSTSGVDRMRDLLKQWLEPPSQRTGAG